MRSKHSYLGHSKCPRRIKEGHLQVEGDEEEKEKAKIVVVKPMERRRGSNFTNPMENATLGNSMGIFYMSVNFPRGTSPSKIKI